MITTQRHAWTGLPIVTESRLLTGSAQRSHPWPSIPSKPFGELASALHEDDTKPWYPAHYEWNGPLIHRTRCWKCGRDLRSWRMMLDRDLSIPPKAGRVHPGSPLLVNGQPAVAFLPLPHFASTKIGVRLTKLNETIYFNAQHCADCSLPKEDADKVVACLLAGADANQSQQGKYFSRVHPTAWATHLYQWSGAEPIGPMDDHDAATLRNVPAPGEPITTAHIWLNEAAVRGNTLPSGIVVEFDGAPPAGWVAHPMETGKILKL